VAWLEETVRLLDIPPLSRYGMAHSDTPRLVEKAARASSMKANPIDLTAAELSEMLEEGMGL
jgi:alcohol dehydrogenase class IV